MNGKINGAKTKQYINVGIAKPKSMLLNARFVGALWETRPLRKQKIRVWQDMKSQRPVEQPICQAATMGIARNFIVSRYGFRSLDGPAANILTGLVGSAAAASLADPRNVNRPTKDSLPRGVSGNCRCPPLGVGSGDAAFDVFSCDGRGVRGDAIAGASIQTTNLKNISHASNPHEANKMLDRVTGGRKVAL